MSDIKQTESQAFFDEGYYCAEAVVKQFVSASDDPGQVLPAIATGLCSGVSRTKGMCGALGGGVLVLSMKYGRKTPHESVAPCYNRVQELVERFRNQCGATNCAELLGCDLGTEEGQVQFGRNELWKRCREYVGVSSSLTGELLEDKIGE